MKTDAHIIYRSKVQKLKNGKGKIFKGVTTVTGGQCGWGKHFLIQWANNLGLKGISSDKYRDETADIGTLGHAFITDSLLERETDTSDYSENQIKAAKNVLASFERWKKQYAIIPISIATGNAPIIEWPMVSERYEYGGTIDIYAFVNGTRELIDIKTGSVHDVHYVQVGGGYVQLLEENGFPVERIRILNLPRTDDENFIDIIIRNRQICWEAFLHMLKLYDLQKRINGKGE